MNILGISAYYHDAAACLLVDGELVAAAQEERFTRIKHDSSFPTMSIEYCLSAAQIKGSGVDLVAFYDKPFLKFERLVETVLAAAPFGYESFRVGLPNWLQYKLFQKSELCEMLAKALQCDLDWSARIRFSEHHLSHAASAYFPSPYCQAAVLTMDGVGEWATTSIYNATQSKLEPLAEICFPHSVGLLYSAFTYYLGFKVNSGEYKVMGLAPYGNPIYLEKIKRHLIELRADGSFRLNMEFFDFHRGLTMTNDRFHALFGAAPRIPETPIGQREMDLAASIQALTEELVINAARHAKKLTGATKLVMAGGVALNCVANGKLLSQGIYDGIWVQPAAGDAGGAIGAAYLIHVAEGGANTHRPSAETHDRMQGALLGPSFSLKEIENCLLEQGAVFHQFPEDEVLATTVESLRAGGAVGWFQGRMEFGPRALGARSILADPRIETMQRDLNLKIKFRESFRPFAPAILKERVSEWFKGVNDSDYMMFVGHVAEDRHIPSVTHVDGSARVQTVGENANRRFRKLLERYHHECGCPVLINTSFNVRGEPIVCSPLDAYKCFMGTDLDLLVMENFVLKKSEQPQENLSRYETRYELD